ncbi:MAG: acyltransferase family protein [Legionella sp.]|uniref:acyltransferase family protein n=1 Tax=Legionella sp. TaxID=459 RepID=UPI0039E4EAFE
MKYRPDIDGLRAIAILLVLFFHSGLKLFPSGFIGVDIFFVISGFLITGIIHDSLQANHFSFIKFYSRRLWRLQPVLICLILSTIFFTLFFYLPEDLIRYFKSARKTSLFISNTFFQGITKGYFSPNNNQLPLLHTWSLSIEWQCYLIFPIVIYLLYRFFKRHVTKIIYLLTCFFFGVTLFFSLKYPVTNYYHLPSRIFEFLIGSCIIFGSNRFSFNKYFLELINSVALLSIFYIARCSNINVGFPNGYAFILCAAVGILIASGKNTSKSILTQLLSLKPLVFIGLLSYSLYIWHWPVFVFIRYLGIAETTSVLLLAFSLIFIIAFFSWQYIEKPAQKLNNIKFRYSFTYLFLLPIMGLHVSDYLIKKHAGYPLRFEENARINAQLKQYTNPQRSLCLQEKNIEINTNCVLGAKNSRSKTGFMFGDSHANHLWGFMDTLAQNANISILAHSTAACLSLPGIQQYDWNTRVYTACHEQTERYYNMIKSNHYDFVILSQYWDSYLYNKLITNEPVDKVKERIEKALDDALQIIIASGAKPVLIKSIIARNSYNCFLSHIKHRRKYNSEQCDFDMKSNKSQWQDELFLHLKNKYTQLIIIDPQKVQCPKGHCKADINGIPVFRDSAHMTDYASYHLADSYLKQYNNPLVT